MLLLFTPTTQNCYLLICWFSAHQLMSSYAKIYQDCGTALSQSNEIRHLHIAERTAKEKERRRLARPTKRQDTYDARTTSHHAAPQHVSPRSAVVQSCLSSLHRHILKTQARGTGRRIPNSLTIIVKIQNTIQVPSPKNVLHSNNSRYHPSIKHVQQ